MGEAAVAYVSVVPSAEGFSQKLSAQIDGQGVGARVGDTVGKGFLGKVGAFAGGAAKIIGGTVGAVAGAVGGIALGKGLSRALDIQDAQKKLLGLGHSADAVTKIMDNALASVKGTAFGLGDAATVAASAVAAGIKPGKDLTAYLKLTADTATIAGTSLGDMGSILNQATASGKVYTDTLNQLSDRGVPVFQYLQEEYHTTADGLTDLVKKGKVSAATLNKVLQENLAGSALKSGETARGAFANVGAALGRLGVQFGAGAAVAGAPALFSAMSNAIDRAGVALKPFSDVIDQLVTTGLSKLTTYINGIDFDQVIAGVQTFAGQVQSLFSGGTGGALATSFGSISTSVRTLTPAFAALGQQMPKIGPALASIASSGVQVLAAALGFLADHVDQIIAAMPVIVTALLLWKGATTSVLAANRLLTATQLTALPVNTLNNALRLAAARTELQVASATAVSTGAQNAGILATIRSGIAWTAAKVAMVATSVATGAATAAQWLLNAALSANPIGIVVVAIAALVAGLVWFFTQTKIGQQAWSAFVTFLSQAWTNIVNFISGAVNAVVGFLAQWGPMILAVIAPVIGIPILIATHWRQIVAIAASIWSSVVSAFTGGVARAVAVVVGLASRIISVFTGIGKTLYTAGRAIITNFISGISSMLGAVGDAVGGVMSFVESFFPHSPAQRGPFSGSGWRQVGRSGAALAEQFSSGFHTNLQVTPISTAGSGRGATRIPSAVTGSASSSGGVSVLVNNKTGINLADLIDIRIAKNAADEETAQRLGYQPLVFA